MFKINPKKDLVKIAYDVLKGEISLRDVQRALGHNYNKFLRVFSKVRNLSLSEKQLIKINPQNFILWSAVEKQVADSLVGLRNELNRLEDFWNYDKEVIISQKYSTGYSIEVGTKVVNQTLKYEDDHWYSEGGEEVDYIALKGRANQYIKLSEAASIDEQQYPLLYKDSQENKQTISKFIGSSLRSAALKQSFGGAIEILVGELFLKMLDF